MITTALLAAWLAQVPDGGVNVGPDVVQAEQNAEESKRSSWMDRIEFSGFSRVLFGYTLPQRDEQLVGGNGGFRLADFRLSANMQPVQKLRIVASIEFAAGQTSSGDPTVGLRAVELRDGFAEYAASRFTIVRAGQFRPPYYIEQLVGDGDVPYTTRSVLASGVQPPEGYGPREGLAPDRQVGVQVASEPIGTDAVSFRYALGVFNGNGQNQLFNDNNGVAPFGRVEVSAMKLLTVGVNGYQNARSIGARGQSRLFVNETGYGADLALRYAGASLIGAYLGRSSSYQGGALPAETATGFLGQAAYQHAGTGLEGGVRFAMLEPSSTQVDDKVSELTALVGWRVLNGPMRLVVEYRHRLEEAQATIENNSVNAMLHVVF